jgi:hypothetical protein
MDVDELIVGVYENDGTESDDREEDETSEVSKYKI